MLEKVKNWKAPTEEHENLRNFAIQQLEDSLECSCSDDLKDYYKQTDITYTVEDYKKSSMKYYLKDIERYAKGYREEIEHTEGINKWIDDLVNSFDK